MKFILTESSWVLEDLDPMEWTFLDRIPEMAAGEDLPLEDRQRIFPDPIDVPAGERANFENFLRDWSEFVRPDLESAFSSDCDQVSRDLAMAVLTASDGNSDNGGTDTSIDLPVLKDEKFAPRSRVLPERVEVTRDASDAWYSALNQARLLMNETHDLAAATDQFQWPDPEKGEPFDGARILLLAQYEFYTALQSILVEVMTLNDGLDPPSPDPRGDSGEEGG